MNEPLADTIEFLIATSNTTIIKHIASRTIENSIFYGSLLFEKLGEVFN